MSTLADVAKLAGVGVGTASRALSGRGYVDVAGSAEVTTAVQSRPGTDLVANIVVGGTHLRSWPPDSLGGPDVAVFNTGDREQDIAAERGHAAVQEMYQAARRSLVTWASDWLQVTRLDFLTAAEETWRAIAAGESDPLCANIIRP